jgi:hypothetical protein
MARPEAVIDEVGMRHSQSNAYRGTDVTIVAIALVCATVIAAVGIFSRVSTLDGDSLPAGGQPSSIEQSPLPAH